MHSQEKVVTLPIIHRASAWFCRVTKPSRRMQALIEETSLMAKKKAKKKGKKKSKRR